jgi:ferredoxin
MGSGGMVVMDEDSCMVDVARFFMEFCCDESCGKCPPCRVGTRQMLDLLEKICRGEAEPDDLDRLQRLAAVVRDASLCGLGQTAPNPVLTTLKYFRDEYLAHIVEKRCPALVCRDLLDFTINEEQCVGCSLCARVCPTATIFKREGVKKYFIVADGCIQCGSCFDTCKFDAVLKTSHGRARPAGSPPLEPPPVRVMKHVVKK